MVGIHSEVKFNCDQCSLQTNFQSNLIQHKQAMHKSKVKFGCDHCNFDTLSRVNLIEHKKEKHEFLNLNLPQTRIVFIPEGVKYPLL